MISSGDENQVKYNSGSNHASNFKIRLAYSGRQISNFERNITPWILRHGVHLLINHIYYKFCNKKSVLKTSFVQKNQ